MDIGDNTNPSPKFGSNVPICHSLERSVSDISTAPDNIYEEIALWQSRLLEKEEEASELEIEIQDLETVLRVFLGEYNVRVGSMFMELSRLELRIKEYQHRIDLIHSRKLVEKNLEEIESKINETFFQERRRIDDLEQEISGALEEYRDELEKEEKRNKLAPEFQQQLDNLFRRLALKFHPDKAKDDSQRQDFPKIFIAIREAYETGDMVTLEKYIKQMEREERISNELPAEKLSRLREEYNDILYLIVKFREELDALRSSEEHKMKTRTDRARAEGKDLLQRLTDDAKEKIARKHSRLGEIIDEYKQLIEGVAY